MEQWEWWIATVIVLFGAISGVSWQVSKVAKDLSGVSREVGTVQRELRDHCKSQTVPCPLHDNLEESIAINAKMLYEHHQHHMNQPKGTTDASTL